MKQGPTNSGRGSPPQGGHLNRLFSVNQSVSSQPFQIFTDQAPICSICLWHPLLLRPNFACLEKTTHMWELPPISRTFMCVVKTKHVWELPMIPWTIMCVVFPTHVWFLPNTWDTSKCLVKTTHVWENPNMCVYFQIQGGAFCICTCIWQISYKYLTFRIYLLFQGCRANIMIWEQG